MAIFVGFSPGFLRFSQLWDEFAEIFNSWDEFFWLLEMFIDFLVCVWPGFKRSFQFLGWSLLVLGDFSNFEHLHLVSRLGNYLKSKSIAISRGIVNTPNYSFGEQRHKPTTLLTLVDTAFWPRLGWQIITASPKKRNPPVNWPNGDDMIWIDQPIGQF